MKITIDNKIRIQNPSREMVEWAEKKLILENPNYWQAVKRNPKAKFFMSPYIKYYEYKDNTLTLPRGARDLLRLDDGIDDCTDAPVRVRSSIQLRDYQQGVPEEIAKHESGIARLDTGFGKTLIGIHLAALLGQKTLFIVPKLDLLEQFRHEILKWTDASCGVIQGKHTDIQTFTVATAQTLQRRISAGELRADEFGCVIADECHLFVPVKTRRTFEFFTARFKYGFTATARRSDGQGDALEWIFGPIRVDRTLPRAKPTVRLVGSHSRIRVDEYAAMISEKVRCPVRNDLICSVVKEEAAKGRNILVLTKRVEHYETLQKQLADLRVHAFSSSANKDERRDLLSSLRSQDEEYDVVLGTFSLLSTGIDIPSLDTLVIAGDLKSDVLAEQSAGRVLRLFEGKEDPLIIDIVDVNNPILKKQARERKKFYQRQGWKFDIPKDWRHIVDL